MSKKEEKLERTRQAMLKAQERALTEHPSIPQLHEGVREYARKFGDIFNLWPPAGSLKPDKSTRIFWEKGLRENARTADGSAIPSQMLFEIWADIATVTHLCISNPNSTVNMVRAEYARRSR